MKQKKQAKTLSSLSLFYIITYLFFFFIEVITD